MNFASLIRMHQNKELVTYPNHYLVNCNRKNQNKSFISNRQQNLINRKQNDPFNSLDYKLFDIYQKFLLNPQTQWILQLQSNRVRIHKFEPSKIKVKKNNLQNHEQLQPKLNKEKRSYTETHHQHQQKNCSNLTQQKCFTYHDTHQRAYKNYSPLQKKNPQALAKEENWIEHFNQNKFSFGEDSGVETKQNKITNFETYPDQTKNKIYIQEKHDYKVSQNQINCQIEVAHTGLIRKNNQSQKTTDPANKNQTELKIHPQNTIQSDSQNQAQNIPSLQISNIQSPQSSTAQTKNIEALMIKDLTTEPSKPELKIQSQSKIQSVFIKEAEKSLNKEAFEKNVNQKKKEKIIEIKPPFTKIQTKPLENPAICFDRQQKQPAPDQIFCKFNIRNPIPSNNEKQPQIQQGISLTKDFKSLNKNQSLKNTEIYQSKPSEKTSLANTNQKKSENVSNEKQIIFSSSQRLLTLINESKRLLESKTQKGDNQLERIKKVVLHTPPLYPKQSQFKKSSSNQQKQKIQQQITAEIQQFSLPKSLVSQKCKISNQITWTQSNFEKKNYQSNSNQHKSSGKRKQNDQTNASKQKAVQNKQILQQFGNNNSHSPYQIQNSKATNQECYFKSSYASKLVNLPQSKPINQKDPSVCKKSSVQPYTQPYQPVAQLYQNNFEASANFLNSQSPQIYPDTNGPQIKTYKPYFPVNQTIFDSNKPIFLPSSQIKLNPNCQPSLTSYQFSSKIQSQNQSSVSPLSNNSCIKTNVTTIDKIEVNKLNSKEKQNLKLCGLGIEGVKCVESKIYQVSSRVANIQPDPKEQSIEFSLRINDHFHI